MEEEKFVNQSSENIELRSEEMQEILGRPPRWVIRWGITVIFLVIAGIFVGSYFFKYPEVIAAPIVVTTENLPAQIMAKTTGRIDTLLVQEKQLVAKNELLAVIENPANVADVLYLIHSLDSMRIAFSDENNATYSRPLSENLQLGDLQGTYNAFLKSYEDCRFFVETDYHRKKIKVLEKQMAVQQKVLSQSEYQLSLMKQQVDGAKKLFGVDSTLFAQNAIPMVEYEKARNTRLQNYQSYETAKSGYENQKLSILLSEQAIFDLQQERIDQLAKLRLATTSAYDQLVAQLKSWEQTYLIRSPIAGTTTFTKYWQRNQNITAGETLLTVVPNDSTHIVGKIYLPPQGAGKVKVGQTVNVKLDAYPYLEYGLIKVDVKNIALVPIQQNNVRNYVLEVDFQNRLITNYGKQLDFSQEMQGTAEIVTNDLRLLDRFLNPIKSVLKR